MEKTAKKIADYLLQSKSIIIQPASPFKWASGWNSPIYCDNRRTLAFPEIRNFIRDSFSRMILEKYGKPGLIAGVATGAIAHGMLVADKLSLPFVYVRSAPKSHGTRNQIEGKLDRGHTVVVVEDLISTGGSSLSAVKTLRQAGARVLGLAAIFTYGFDVSAEKFEKAGCPVNTLLDYETLLREAVRMGTISENQQQVLEEWHKNPADWGKNP